MNAILAANLNVDPALALLDAGGSDGAAAIDRLRLLGPPQKVEAEASPILPWLGQTPISVASWLVAPGAPRTAPAGYAPATGNWSFLSDPSLSIEDKLAAFMTAVQKKSDDDLTKKMNDYKAKYGEDADKGVIGNLFASIFPKGSIFEKAANGVLNSIGDAIKALSGPVLAGLATAVGLPALAPAALKAGSSLGQALGDALGLNTKSSSSTKSTSGEKSTSSSSSSSKKGEAGSPDERLAMLEIQRLVEKQNQMFTLVSNVLKSLHDTAMVSIQNIR